MRTHTSSPMHVDLIDPLVGLHNTTHTLLSHTAHTLLTHTAATLLEQQASHSAPLHPCSLRPRLTGNGLLPTHNHTQYPHHIHRYSYSLHLHTLALDTPTAYIRTRTYSVYDSNPQCILEPEPTAYIRTRTYNVY